MCMNFYIRWRKVVTNLTVEFHHSPILQKPIKWVAFSEYYTVLQVEIYIHENGFKLTTFIIRIRIVTLFEIKMTNDSQFAGVIQSLICHILRNTTTHSCIFNDMHAIFNIQPFSRLHFTTVFFFFQWETADWREHFFFYIIYLKWQLFYYSSILTVLNSF